MRNAFNKGEFWVFEKIGCFFQLSMLFQICKESINQFNQSMVFGK